MDEMDRVQEINEQWTDACIEAHRRQKAPLLPLRRGGGVVACEDCDQPIPAARLAAQPNAVRCIDCQNDFEIETRRRH